MPVAPVEHAFGDRVGHLDQQLVALVLAEQLVGDQLAEQDLDVDLEVGGGDAAHVVDRVGVDATALVLGAALGGVLDASTLG